LRTTTGSVSCAMRRRGPPQCGPVRTSTANTRRRSSAQVERVERDEREREELLGAVGELGASGSQARSGLDVVNGAGSGEVELFVRARRCRSVPPLATQGVAAWHAPSLGVGQSGTT
jgi:hypothetical protein